MAQKAKQTEEVITVNLQSILMPLAIILSTIIFSTSFLVGTFRIANRLEGGSTTSGTRDTVSDTVDDAPVAPTNEYGETVVGLDDDPYLGDLDSAKVAIVEFTDLECPFCQRHHEQTFPQIIENFVNTGDAIYVSRDFPLSFHNPAAEREAIAAECVDDQLDDEAYFEYTDLIFDNSLLNAQGLPGGDADLIKYAEQVGANKSEFEKCLEEERFKDEVADDLADGTAAGVTGTPGFVIGTINEDGEVEGVLVSGAQSYSEFERIIQEQLDK